MHKKRIIHLRPAHKPSHCPLNVPLGGQTPRIALVVRQNHHVLPPVPLPLRQERRHIRHVVDAPLQLVRLAEVVDPDQESLAPPGAGRVLEVVIWRRAVSEVLGAGGGAGWEVIYIGIGV